jgi:multicomponent Na+:H+ antiporter subunit D
MWTTIEFTIAWFIGSPLVLAALSPWSQRWRLPYLALGLLLPLANVALLLQLEAANQLVSAGPFLTFVLDSYSWYMVFLIHASWAMVQLYAEGYFARTLCTHKAHFHGWLSLAMVAITANALAGNMRTLLFSYLLGILATFPLIRLRRNVESYRAGAFYLLHMLGSYLLVLLPTQLLYIYTYGDAPFNGPLQTALAAHPHHATLILVGLVLGMGANLVFPFDRWLPRTMITPAPVTALVHTVAVVNFGAIALLKFGKHILGTDAMHTLSHEFWHTGWLLYLLGINAVVAAWRALKTQNVKERFSYSTVSQVSYILTAILIGTPAAMLGALLHMLSHAIAKMCLFFVAGYFNAVHNTLKAPEIGHLMPHTRVLAAVVAICGFSIIGFPLFAGYFSKDLMLIAEIQDHHYFSAGFLVLGSLINVLYIHPIIRAAFRKRQGKRVALRMPVAMGITIVLCIVLIFAFSSYVYEIVRRVDPSLAPSLELLGVAG